jgi:OFA family oxalate/formate antiporter-like MFS transporter
VNKALEQWPGNHASFFYGYILVIASACIMALFVGTFAAFGVFFKPVLKEFGWSRAMTSGAFSLCWILQGSLAIVMGKLTDKIGPRAVMTLCGLFLGLGYLGMSMLGSNWQFYLLYGIIGVGMSGLNVSLVSTASRWFIERRGFVTGIILAGGGLGTLTTPPLAHWLISAYSWRQSYIIMGSTVLLVSIIAAQFLRRDPSQMGQLPYGHDTTVAAAEMREAEGDSPKDVVRTKAFWMIAAMYFALGFCPYVVIVHVVPHATDLDIPAPKAAALLAVMGLFAILGRIILGGAGDKIGNRKTFMVSLALMTLSVFLFIWATDFWMIFVAVAIISFSWGVGALGSPLMAEFFGLKSLGTNVGFINMVYSVGAAASPFMAGYVFDMTHSYRSAFMMTTLVAFLAFILSILLKPR